MILTTTRIQELLNIIERQHLLFISKHVGSDILSDQDLLKLKGFGVDIKQLPKTGTVDEAFKFGMLSDAIGHKRAKLMNYATFKKWLSGSKFLPLTAVERGALNVAKLQTYSDLKGLGNKISRDLTQTFIEVDKRQRQKYQKIVAKEVKEGILNRSTISELSSELSHKTGDWARDFDRIADYVLHDSFTRGKAEQIAKTYGNNAYVYMEVLSTACPSCRGLYLKPNGEPKVFPLSYVIANGSNIGRKQKQWRVTTPPLHVWCRCELFVVQPGYDYDPETGMFSKPKPYVSTVGRRSKVGITIDGKEIE